MVRWEKSIIIKASPEKVWEMLAWDRHPEWNETFMRVEYTSEVRIPEDKFRVGAVAHITVAQKPEAKVEADQNREECDFTITESLKHQKITYAIHGMRGARNLFGSYTLKPTEEGTEMTLVYAYEMPWGFFGKLIDKLYNYLKGEKDTEKSLENLRRILEQ